MLDYSIDIKKYNQSTPTWRVGALMQESPAKKQRKSLVRAIINLLDTKYK